MYITLSITLSCSLYVQHTHRHTRGHTDMHTHTHTPYTQALTHVSDYAFLWPLSVALAVYREVQTECVAPVND